MFLLIVISLIIFIIIISVALFYSNKKNTQVNNVQEEEEEQIEDDDPLTCTKETITVENPSIMLKQFFDNNYSEKYLFDPTSTGGGLVLSEYDLDEGAVIEVVPYKMFQKILKSKINTDGITVFVGQVALSAGKIETAKGEKNPLKAIQVFHSALFFVETSKYKANGNIVLPEHILFSLELWAPGQGLGAASCLYPVLTEEGKVDILNQDVCKIIVQYPEAFGCKDTGGYWDGHWNEMFYIGDTSVSVIEKLYQESFEWLSKNWGYSALSLVSSPCIEEENIILPSNAVLGNTCESFIEAMCLVLEKLDKANFKNLLSNLPFNDVELIGTWMKLPLEMTGVPQLVSAYNTKVQLILNATKKKDSLDFDAGGIPIPKDIRDLLKRQRGGDSDVVMLGENGPENRGKQNRISNQTNMMISSVLIPTLIKKLSKIGMVEDGNLSLLVTIFNSETTEFDVYKVTLEHPYLQNMYSVCPSMLYKEIHSQI